MLVRLIFAGTLFVVIELVDYFVGAFSFPWWVSLLLALVITFCADAIGDVDN